MPRRPLHSSCRDRRRIGLAFGLLAGSLLLALTLLQAPTAAAQSKSEELAQVRERQAKIAEQLEAHNGEVNALIGQVSELRQREAAAGAELADRQAELEDATAELQDGRERLAEVRKELAKASAELEEMLVSLYKSGNPDLGELLLDSSNFEDFAAQSEYFDRLQNYQSSVIDRTRSLRDESVELVAQLADDRARIEDARDQIAARRDELASSRADLEQQEAALAAARHERRSALDSLSAREDSLVEALSTPTEPATAAPVEAAPAPVPGQTAKLDASGNAIPPAGAPPAVVAAIQAANQISSTPYIWGGGHGSFDSPGYDCSGAVSYALHGGGLLSSPLDSTGLMTWGEAGPGRWITVYANSGHAFAVIAGLRWDTSGGAGPRWHADAASTAGFVARHPSGL